MKHTYIFEVADGVTEYDLERLVRVLQMRMSSYKTSQTDQSYDRVQVFTDENMMHHVAHRAGFSGEQLRVALPAARRRGDMAVKQASKRLDALRRRPLVPSTARKETPRIEGSTLWMAVALDRLRKAGCDIKVYLIPPMSYEIVVFGEVFALESSSEARGFLAGLEKGFISTPLQMPGGTKRSKRSA